jgi:hypothetical protein
MGDVSTTVTLLEAWVGFATPEKWIGAGTSPRPRIHKQVRGIEIATFEDFLASTVDNRILAETWATGS